MSAVLLTVVGIVGLFCVLLSIFMVVRNNAVYKVRRAFLDRDDWVRDYYALPDYYAMVERPRYWGMWTEAQWREWLKRNATTVNAKPASPTTEPIPVTPIELQRPDEKHPAAHFPHVTWPFPTSEQEAKK